jgi:hypothetical protein
MQMRQLARGSLLLLLALAAPACAARKPGARSTGVRARTDLLTSEQINRGGWPNLYDAIQALRPRWLQARGPDTLVGQQGEVQVHLNEVRVGGINSLRDMPSMGIVYVQFIDPNTAAARWGMNHGHGAIYISTRAR